MSHTLAMLASLPLADWWEVGPDWFYHPLGQCAPASANAHIAAHEIARCRSYNWYSGFAANFGELVILTGLSGFAWRVHKHLECHVELPKNCHRLGRPVAGTGHRACRRHHPHADERGTGITAASILERHEDAKSE